MALASIRGSVRVSHLKWYLTILKQKDLFLQFRISHFNNNNNKDIIVIITICFIIIYKLNPLLFLYNYEEICHIFHGRAPHPQR